MKASRRKFINIIFNAGILGSVASIFYPVLNFLIPPEKREPKVSSLKIGKLDNFELDSYKIVKFGREPIIVIRTDAGDIKALTATCTHLDCIVQYQKDKKRIHCACHNGVYDLNGRNVSGPPPKPLTEYNVAIIDDEIIVSSQKS